MSASEFYEYPSEQSNPRIALGIRPVCRSSCPDSQTSADDTAEVMAFINFLEWLSPSMSMNTSSVSKPGNSRLIDSSICVRAALLLARFPVVVICTS